MKQLKNLLPLMLLALLAWNCQKEETSIPQENTTGAATKSAIHKINYQQLPLHILGEVVHSSGAVQGKGPSGKGGTPFGNVRQDQVNVMETENGTTSYTLGMEKLDNGLYMDNLVVTEDADGTLRSHILRYKPTDEWLAEMALGEADWEAYSGEIFVFDGEGDSMASGQFSEGKAAEQVMGKTAADKALMYCEVTNVSYGGLEQDGVFYATDIIIDYECSGGGSSGVGAGSGFSGTGNGGGQSQGGGQSHGGGGGGSSAGDGSQGGNGQVSTVIDKRLFFEKIDVDESVDPCVVVIINKLALKDVQNLTMPDIGQLDGTGHLSQGILDLFDSSGNYDLVFKVAEAGYSNGVPRTAKTQKTEGKMEWTITLDDDYVNKATQLSIARTIIHESVHAFIGYSINTNKTASLAEYLNDYRLELLLNPNNSYSQDELENLSEHSFISQFIDAMAISLSVWDNNQQSMNYYKKLSWAGLESSSAYQAQPNKNEIQSAITNESNGYNNAKGVKCPK